MQNQSNNVTNPSIEPIGVFHYNLQVQGWSCSKWMVKTVVVWPIIKSVDLVNFAQQRMFQIDFILVKVYNQLYNITYVNMCGWDITEILKPSHGTLEISPNRGYSHAISPKKIRFHTSLMGYLIAAFNIEVQWPRSHAGDSVSNTAGPKLITQSTWMSYWEEATDEKVSWLGLN